MKKKFLSLVLAVLPLAAVAQDEFIGEIRWGTPLTLKKGESGPYPIGLLNGELYGRKTKNADALNPKKRIHFLQIYDLATLSLKKEVQMSLEYNGHSLILESNFIFNGRVVFISYYADKEAEKKVYLIHEIESGKVSHPMVLAEMNDSKAGKLMVTMNSYLKMSSFSYMLSPDKETMMVFYTNEVTATDKEVELNMVAYDKEMNEISRGVLDIGENYSISRMGLLNDGRLLLLGYESAPEVGEGIKSDKVKNGDFYVMLYDGVNVEKTKVDIGKHLNSFLWKVEKNGSIVLFGLYSDTGESGVDGAFFVKLTADLNIDRSTTEEFEDDFITQFWTDKQKKKQERKEQNGDESDEPKFYNYFIHDLVVKENGDYMLLAEQYDINVTTQTYRTANGGTQTVTSYHYLYNDIIAVNCAASGEVNWKKAIKKRQRSTNDGGYYSSFFTTVQGNNVYLIYNNTEAGMDEEETENMNTREKKAARRNILTAIYSIGENGDIDHKKLFDFEDEQERMLVPSACVRMSQNEILLFTNSTKEVKMLGWLTL